MKNTCTLSKLQMKLFENTLLSTGGSLAITAMMKVPYGSWSWEFFCIFATGFFCFSTFYAPNHHITNNWPEWAKMLKDIIGGIAGAALLILGFWFLGLMLLGLVK